MTEHFRRTRNLVHAGVLAGAILVATPASSPAQQGEVLAEGKVEYQENCMACHGEAGKGDGRMAEILIVKPSDLTQVGKRSSGVFPFWRVYKIIEGTEPVKGHFFYPMPLWGERFREDEKRKGYPAAYLRILVLTHYVQSIQEE